PGGNFLFYAGQIPSDPWPVVTNKLLQVPAGAMRIYFEDQDAPPSSFVPRVTSTYLKRQWLRHVFHEASWLPPSDLWLGLTRGVQWLLDPETYTEFSGGGYTRINVSAG